MIRIKLIRVGFVTVAIAVDDFYVIHTAKGMNPRGAKKRLAKKMERDL